ncbi:E3 ubiquitin-protein ligase RAD18 isoform X3 [Esox lucius]|uniref:RING-type E3 ubiquitin transferase n=1 Tax=Esox lucius TaxID=8010 RepID=A0A3P8YQ06_ESOLU|nr:E3 ubiquitin-protein ligase RAD18 isoform X3 [Esox lucius]
MANFNIAELQPNLTCLKNVDTLLRCPICFEFLNIPMMTKCSHNFCSLCIRKFLSYKLLCPVCNSITTEQDLRNNRILDDLITTFQIARQQMSKAHFDTPPISPKTPSSTIKCKTPGMYRGPKKEGSILNHFFQKAPTTSSSAVTTAAVPTPRGKRQSGALECSQTMKESPRHTLNVNADSSLQVSVKEEPMDLEIPAQSVKMRNISTGLVSLANSQSTSQDIKPLIKVECPVCSVGISEQFINKHLDICLTRGEKHDSLRSSLGAKRKPMGKLVYTLLSMQELKRRLKECHLSVQGNRDQLVRRHQDFVHMYNAQCDALEPKPAESIAKEVEANEKARNQLKGKTKSAMVFSKNQSVAEIGEIHSTYIKQHSHEFSQLIAEVRGRRKTTKKMKQEMGVSGGEEGQGVCSSSTDKAAVQEQSKAIPNEPGAYCLLMSTPVKEPSEEQHQPSLEDVIARSPSPCLSDRSISSSISDVFVDRCFERSAPTQACQGVCSPATSGGTSSLLMLGQQRKCLIP